MDLPSFLAMIYVPQDPAAAPQAVLAKPSCTAVAATTNSVTSSDGYEILALARGDRVSERAVRLRHLHRRLLRVRPGDGVDLLGDRDCLVELLLIGSRRRRGPEASSELGRELGQVDALHILKDDLLLADVAWRGIWTGPSGFVDGLRQGLETLSIEDRGWRPRRSD